MEAVTRVAGKMDRPVDGGGIESGAEGGLLADGCSGSPRLGSASIEQPTTNAASDPFSDEQLRRLERLRLAAEEAAEVFAPLSPWGSASRAIESRLTRAIQAARGTRLQPLPAEDHPS